VTPIGVNPRHILVGPAKETEAAKIVSPLQPTADVNPFTTAFSIHVEPRLTGNSWRVFADPSELPVIELAYLNGVEGPQLSVREGWEVLGAEFRCVLDVGAGLTPGGFRGCYLDPGA
jgi:hypothetical protein